jgi:hypothetical protein
MFDLIHSHYWLSGLVGGRLKALWHVPHVVMFHTLGEMKNRIARTEAEREGAYRIDGEKQVIQRANRGNLARSFGTESIAGIRGTVRQRRRPRVTGSGSNRWYGAEDEPRLPLQELHFTPQRGDLVLDVGGVGARRGGRGLPRRPGPPRQDRDDRPEPGDAEQRQRALHQNDAR